MNRITVVSENDTVDAQARTYAEYRVFAVLARHAGNIRRVRVVLRHADAGETCARVTCAVTVTLAPSGVLRWRATGAHAYAAINRAVERLGEELGRRAEGAPLVVNRPPSRDGDATETHKPELT